METIPGFDFSAITVNISPSYIRLGFLILVLIVAAIGVVLGWHWLTYHPRKSVALFMLALFGAVTIAILVGIGNALGVI